MSKETLTQDYTAIDEVVLEDSQLIFLLTGDR